MRRSLLTASLLTLGMTTSAFANGAQELDGTNLAKLTEAQHAEAEAQDCLGDAESRPPETLQVYTAVQGGKSDDSGQTQQRPPSIDDCALV